ncbi:hypothetical protein PBY51_019718 [Eleginops maclovinus]|uniref:Uncharacterized protein n=1 Tax=Eleginops maclovinus TaxID=56733 RepID=A0AAN7XT60_ELEMC|nr:hypothetical protein PBY51_019718 [Eleginops maclovinus]
MTLNPSLVGGTEKLQMEKRSLKGQAPGNKAGGGQLTPHVTAHRPGLAAVSLLKRSDSTSDPAGCTQGCRRLMGLKCHNRPDAPLLECP